MLTVRNVVKRTGIALPMLFILSCAFVVLSAYKTRMEAQAILNEFRELGASKNPTASFELLRRRYESTIHAVEGCTAQSCQYEMKLSNSAISMLHVVPYAEMNVWFTMYKGSLVWAMLEYRTALKGPNSPVIHVQQGMCAHGCGVRFDVNPHGTTHHVWNGLVEFNTRATPQQRDAALGINLECLARIGGCKDIIDLLPTMWMYSGAGIISSRFVGLSQRLEESHAFPSLEDDF